MKRCYVAQYPDSGTEKFFDEFLKGLPDSRAAAIARAILGLEDEPRPQDPVLGYIETKPEKSAVLLRRLPGKPFRKGFIPLLDYLDARHHITVEGVTVVYAINDSERFVWLMGIRNAL